MVILRATSFLEGHKSDTKWTYKITRFGLECLYTLKNCRVMLSCLTKDLTWFLGFKLWKGKPIPAKFKIFYGLGRLQNMIPPYQLQTHVYMEFTDLIVADLKLLFQEHQHHPLICLSLSNENVKAKGNEKEIYIATLSCKAVWNEAFKCSFWVPDVTSHFLHPFTHAFHTSIF